MSQRLPLPLRRRTGSDGSSQWRSIDMAVLAVPSALGRDRLSSDRALLPFDDHRLPAGIPPSDGDLHE